MKIPSLLSILILLFVSCDKKDPEPDGQNIAGEWRAQYSREGIFTYPQLQPAFPTNFSQTYPYRDEILLNFQPDLKFKESFANPNAPNGYFSASYNYALNGNTII